MADHRPLHPSRWYPPGVHTRAVTHTQTLTERKREREGDTEKERDPSSSEVHPDPPRRVVDDRDVSRVTCEYYGVVVQPLEAAALDSRAGRAVDVQCGTCMQAL